MASLSELRHRQLFVIKNRSLQLLSEDENIIYTTSKINPDVKFSRKEIFKEIKTSELQ